MESRNISLTTCGERLDHSPRDRKAVSDIYDLFQPAVAAPAVCYPLYNLIPEIISDENLERSFKRVMANLRSADTRSGNRQREIAVIDGIECSPRMVRYVKNKHKILDALKEQIGNGTFRIKNLKSFTVDDGPKVRIVQAPSVIERIGSNAIMEPLEKHLSPLLIETTAASIQGRGPHGLFHQVQDTLAENPNIHYYYQSDYKGYYDSIDHDILISTIRRYVGDPVLLPILENFVKALYPNGKHGISKGLRSSQFFGNLYHNDIDHRMIDEYGAKHYFRFCDDIFILGESKRDLWKLRDKLHYEAAQIGLTIKPSEKVAPISAGMDALGFVNYGDYTLLRKRTKVNAARKLSKIKSRKRRQQIIGSFKGMACHAD